MIKSPLTIYLEQSMIHLKAGLGLVYLQVGGWTLWDGRLVDIIVGGTINLNQRMFKKLNCLYLMGIRLL